MGFLCTIDMAQCVQGVKTVDRSFVFRRNRAPANQNKTLDRHWAFARLPAATARRPVRNNTTPAAVWSGHQRRRARFSRRDRSLPVETENGPAVVDIMLNLEENSREF